MNWKALIKAILAAIMAVVAGTYAIYLIGAMASLYPHSILILAGLLVVGVLAWVFYYIFAEG